MELSALKDKILSKFKGTQEQLSELLKEIDKDKASFPFNEYELLLTSMIANKYITFEDYKNIRDEYIKNNANLHLFEISSPRDFGENYGQTIIQKSDKNIQLPDKNKDPNYSGQYDLWLDGIRIEVKASRMTDKKSKEPLYKKALPSYTNKEFSMNFQQLKPQLCDVFVLVAVCRDCDIFWVISSNDILNHPDYSKGQHRGNKGNEGQLHITNKNISTLDPYRTDLKNIGKRIKEIASDK